VVSEVKVSFQVPLIWMNKCPVCNIDLGLVSNKDLHVNNCLDNDNGSTQIIGAEAQSNINPTFPHNLSSLTCPYEECNQVLKPDFFPTHVTSRHFAEVNQNYACPLCTQYEENSRHNTNLLDHLADTHFDLIGIYDNVISNDGFVKLEIPPITTSVTPTRKVSHDDLFSRLETQPNNHYLAAMVLKELPNQECSLCLQIFQKNEISARLECWCLYHQECIDLWWNISKKQTCPTHQ